MQSLSAKYVFSQAPAQLIFTDFNSMMQDSWIVMTIFRHILHRNMLFANAKLEIPGIDYK
jgi:hypothetical protein